MRKKKTLKISGLQTMFLYHVKLYSCYKFHVEISAAQV